MSATSKPNEKAITEDFEFEALDRARNYRAAIIKEFHPWLRGQVWEVGCGIGQMTQSLLELERISHVTCIEPDPRFAAIHKERFPSLRLIEGTVAHITAPTSPDCIVSINVLEHIEDDAGELRKYQEALAEKRGTLCLLVPARPEIYAPIDSDFGHFRRYKLKELGDKLRKAGLVPGKIHYFNSLGYLAWLIKFKLMKSRSFDAGQVEFYDSKIFPVVHRLESQVFRPPIGQSLVVAATAA